MFSHLGTVRVVNSTFSRNVVTGGAGGGTSPSPANNGSPGTGHGSAVFSVDGTLALYAVTSTGNTGGADFEQTTDVLATHAAIHHSIVTAIVSHGFASIEGAENLVEAMASPPSGFVLSSAAPGLLPLADNGGFVPTMALPSGAIASALPCTGPSGILGHDARRVPRGAASCDPGAYQRPVACVDGAGCALGSCTDGVCCRGADGLDAACVVCAEASGAQVPGVASPRPMGDACGDGSASACNAADTCDGAGACSPGLAADGAPCDDGLFCTETSACLAGACVGAGQACAGTCDEAQAICVDDDEGPADAAAGCCSMGDGRGALLWMIVLGLVLGRRRRGGRAQSA